MATAIQTQVRPATPTAEENTYLAANSTGGPAAAKASQHAARAAPGQKLRQTPCPTLCQMPCQTPFISTPEYEIHFLILSESKTCLYVKVKNLGRCAVRDSGPQLLQNALQLVEAFADASRRPNAIKMVFDVRATQSLSWLLLWPLVEWMKEVKPLFQQKLCESHVLLNSSLWREALRRMIQLAGTARPVHINACPFQAILPCS
jgi:hypothetical protein